MTISNTMLKVNVDQVGAVIVTDIAYDAENNLYSRSIQVYGPNGYNNLDQPQFTMVITGASRAAVEISTPPTVF